MAEPQSSQVLVANNHDVNEDTSHDGDAAEFQVLLPKATSWAKVIYDHLLNTQYPLIIKYRAESRFKLQYKERQY